MIFYNTCNHFSLSFVCTNFGFSDLRFNFYIVFYILASVVLINSVTGSFVSKCVNRNVTDMTHWLLGLLQSQHALSRNIKGNSFYLEVILFYSLIVIKTKIHMCTTYTIYSSHFQSCFPVLVSFCCRHSFVYMVSVITFLSTHVDRQSVDISFTVCVCVCLFVCLFVRFRISPPRIKLAASNFARWSSAYWAGNLAFWKTLLPRSSPRSPKSDESASALRPARVVRALADSSSALRPARWPRVGSACVDNYTAVPEEGRTCLLAVYISVLLKAIISTRV